MLQGLPVDRRVALYVKLKQNNGTISGDDLKALGIAQEQSWLDRKFGGMAGPEDMADLVMAAYRAAGVDYTLDRIESEERQRKFEEAMGAILLMSATGQGGGQPAKGKAPAGKVNNKASNMPKTETAPKLKLEDKLKEHVLNGNNIPGLGRDIKGAHNKKVFDQYAGNLKILDRKPHPTIKGVETVYYKVPAQDKAGNIIPNVYKNSVYKKTVYDPSFLSDEQFYQGGLEAARNAMINGQLPREWTGYSNSGILYRGYTNVNGEVTSFFISSPSLTD